MMGKKRELTLSRERDPLVTGHRHHIKQKKLDRVPRFQDYVTTRMIELFQKRESLFW
jgi:hypothetical protein